MKSVHSKAMADSSVSRPLSATEESLLSAFESYCSRHAAPAIEGFLRDRGVETPGLTVLAELVRVEMELRSRATGHVPATAEYLARFPRLAQQPFLREIAFEEWRLAESNGEGRKAEEFVGKFGLDPAQLARCNRIPQVRSSEGTSGRGGAPANSGKPQETKIDASGFPVVPGQFLGFELVGLLGQGAFGRVFLARQGDLARRWVALKVTRQQSREAQHLAQLQHSNIVPVFSIHQHGDLQAICMPFLGLATLADVIRTVANRPCESMTGQELVSTVVQHKTVSLCSGAAENDTSEVESESPWLGQGTVTVNPQAGLASRSFFQTVGWLFKQVNDGLEYAHGLGIVHGDIKPANIILSDDGRPLLLDFHLSVQAGQDAIGFVGGTLPYMAPEHLQAVAQGRQPDAHCDVYSLGAVFYEMLSHRLPFPELASELDQESLKKLLAERLRGATPLTKIDRQIHPDLASIVEKCLAPQQADRYDSAAELRIDLDRFLTFQPLQFASNRSWRVRFDNWVRRHPRLSSATTVFSVAAIALLMVSAALWNRSQRLSSIENSERHRTYVEQLQLARMPLTVVEQPRELVRNQIAALAMILSGGEASPSSEDVAPPIAHRLPPSQQSQLRDELAYTHFVLAGAWMRQAAAESDLAEKSRQLSEADSHRAQALRILPDLESSLGWKLQGRRRDQLAEIPQPADPLPGQSAEASNWENNLVAYEYLSAGDAVRAAEILQSTVAAVPTDFEAWLMLGNAQARLGKLESAEASYTVCLGLCDRSEIALFNRSLVRLDLAKIEEALQDLNQVIALNPDESTYLANRGLLHIQTQKWERAEADFSRALELGSQATRLYLLRSQVRRALGMEKEAEDDERQFLAGTPADEESLISRALVWFQKGNVESALADLEFAVQLYPDSVVAWQNRAAILSEQPNRLADAIESIRRVVELRKNDSAALATLGILLARSNDRDAALQTATQALEGDPTADTLYRVADIYALTSREVPADRATAVALLATAWLKDPALVSNYMQNDVDLIPLQEDPGFSELQRAIGRIESLIEPKDQ